MLVPEAIRQILLWREGKRTSIDLIPKLEEQDLYDQGNILLEWEDWVEKILADRAQAMKSLAKAEEALKGSSKTRPGKQIKHYYESD